LHEDTVRGALTVYSSKPNAFDPETVEVLVIFARQCAMALVNAGLYDEARRYIEELLRASQHAPAPPGGAGEKG
jgi:GAF domain-containing protein